jgi:hypothetical protein
MYLFTDDEIPDIKWNEDKPGLYTIKVVIDNEIELLKWNNDKKNVFKIGSRQGCGCGWTELFENDTSDEKSGKIEDRKSLKKLIEKINDKYSWMIVCWEGDQGNDMLETEELFLSDIENPKFEFEELRKYTFNY